MLENIHSPEDIRGLSDAALKALTDEIRRELIETVSQTGGHLASNLGAVEMTIALHQAFHAPEDKLLFDVGHQSYVHKMLTGRFTQMKTLRQLGGISGFTRREESEYDAASAGHASDSLSLALGMARARDLKGEKNHIVAVVGDGALTGGMCYEALNDAGHSKTRLIVILNDNEMSISKNVGALSRHLTKMRQSSFYRSFKQRVRMVLGRIPRFGDQVTAVLSRIRDSVKSLLIADSFFEALGVDYLGPIDGHNIRDMVRVFEKAKEYDAPVVIHLVTQKGRGYEHAEKRPDKFHGIAPFFVDSGKTKASSGESAGCAAADHLIRLAEENPGITCISAAMLDGTGLNRFKKAFPDRCFDVGIAEEHAVAMAAGMALNGMKPFVALYSSFLQRGYDQVMIDACVNNAPVTFLIDRAGLNGADGMTHQGVFDLGFLRAIPGMIVSAPADTAELRRLIDLSLSADCPMAIRYPKDLPASDAEHGFAIGEWEIVREGSACALLAGGRMLAAAEGAAQLLSKNGIDARVINARFIKPFDEGVLQILKKDGIPVFTLEDGAVSGGFGEGVLSWMSAQKAKNPVHIIGVPDRFIGHATVGQQLSALNMDAEGVSKRIEQILKGEDHAASRR